MESLFRNYYHSTRQDPGILMLTEPGMRTDQTRQQLPDPTGFATPWVQFDALNLAVPGALAPGQRNQ